MPKYTKKPFKERDIIDDFLMNAVAIDPEVGEAFCRKTLSEPSDKEIPVLNIYDIEPHKQDTQFMPKRNRFYQVKIDSRYMKSGETDFEKLPNLYVITITNYDPFGERII